MNCRFCQKSLEQVFLDLGTAPPSNAYLGPDDLAAAETWFPLQLRVCSECLLVQVDEVQHHAALFAADYAYYSSYSSSWVEHARRYVQETTRRLALGPSSLVFEIASNDGYLLQFVAAAGVPCLGIEPTAGTARAARARGIETIEAFFGRDLAARLRADRGPADLIVANNVLAHVPDLNDFIAGIALLLAPEGVVSFEFPHLLALVSGRQFDTVYHEHFSYFSLHTVRRVLAAHGLRVWDVERLATHGGSLRVWATLDSARHPALAPVERVLLEEEEAGMLTMDYYRGFQAVADAVKDGLLEFLLDSKRRGLRIAAYGAAAKGNTLLNYAGVRRDLLPYVVDASPHKQGRFLPGSRIPILAETALRADRPDVVLILPWNLRDEVSSQLSYVRAWNGRFATAVPAVELW